MSSGFATTGGNNGAEEADPAQCGGVEAAVFAAVEQWLVGTGVLSARSTSLFRRWRLTLKYSEHRVTRREPVAGAEVSAPFINLGDLRSGGPRLDVRLISVVV